MTDGSANTDCFTRLCRGTPVLLEVKRASAICPLLNGPVLLHAGPSLEWSTACGPVRAGAECAAVYEGWAKDYEEAGRAIERAGIRLEPTHHHSFVGPVAGIISGSMWVFCVRNETDGNWAYCNMSEGMGRALRFGAQGEDVLRRLEWMEHVLGPVLADAVQRSGGIDLKEIITLSLEMGDDCHNRHEAARLLLLRRLLPHLIASDYSRDTLHEVIEFLADNYYFFVNLCMAACKALTDTVPHLPGSTIVTTMARNGTEFGIRVAGLGSRWFTAPCNSIRGIYFPGYSEEDGNPDLGDSTITETAGIGAFAMAASPAICRYIGGTPDEMLESTLEMYRITHGEHPDFQIPALDYRGTPTGIDVRSVVTTGITPVINTSIAHKEPGIGQIGAGRTRAPLKCFTDALAAIERDANEVSSPVREQGQ